ncbi:MAG: DNA/RNA nuclease SfsA [bacterium]
MNWPEGPLVLGRFQERLHRFGAKVRVRGRVEYCHVTNSGRLRELLRPGARVALVDHRNHPLRSGGVRKTRYAIRLAFYRKQWVCIEANVAPRLLAEAWEKGKIPELIQYDALKAEVPLNHHTRFDFLAENSATGEKAWIEVKCVTLVDAQGLGRFPDAPSERAVKHLLELRLLSRIKKTKAFVFFILQNGHGRSVGPQDATDPLFGKTLRAVSRSKLSLHAWRARVDLKGAWLEKAVPLDLRPPTPISAKDAKVIPTRTKTKEPTRLESASTKPVHSGTAPHDSPPAPKPRGRRDSPSKVSPARRPPKPSTLDKPLRKKSSIPPEPAEF